MSSLYLNEELESAEIGSAVTLVGDEAKHAVTVARARIGERIAVGNGRGLLVWGTITVANPSLVQVAVGEIRIEERPSPELWLAQALAKGDRDELAVQAATELGVAGVIPWAAERSIIRWEGAKAERGRTRWQSIVREASKQSIRAWVPAVDPVASGKTVANGRGQILVLDPLATEILSCVPIEEGDRLTIVVGPEGGITNREAELFESAGGTRVRLGSEVLRTSTAGLAALAVLNVRLSRW
jgi:16S rRNA (uracil1498-N3)-methyltransferase